MQQSSATAAIKFPFLCCNGRCFWGSSSCRAGQNTRWPTLLKPGKASSKTELPTSSMLPPEAQSGKIMPVSHGSKTLLACLSMLAQQPFNGKGLLTMTELQPFW